MNQTIADLTDAEIAWAARQNEAAAQFVAPEAISLAALDRAFKHWSVQNPDDVSEINRAVNLVGAAFGQFLVDGVGLKWVIATDDHGSDLAVFGLPGAGDVLVYPPNLVAKRWERRESDSLEKLYGEISATVRSLRAQTVNILDSCPGSGPQMRSPL